MLSILRSNLISLHLFLLCCYKSHLNGLQAFSLEQWQHPSPTELRCLSYRSFGVYFTASETQTSDRAGHGSAPIVTLPEHEAIIAHASPIWAENKTRWENEHHGTTAGGGNVKGRSMTRLTCSASLHFKKNSLKLYIFINKSSEVRPPKTTAQMLMVIQSELIQGTEDQGSE